MFYKNALIGFLITFGLSCQAKDCELAISGSDMMQFDKTVLEVGSDCSAVKLILKHSGSLTKNVMGHNVVIVASDKFDNVIASINMEAGIENGYLAENADVLTKTAMIGGGEITETTLDLSKFSKGVDYTFFCSFPGHYAIMKGKFVI